MEAECLKCKKTGLHFKFNELTRRNVLFENNDTPHICPASTYDVNQTVINLSTKYHDKLKFKIPIWCNKCESYYKPNAVCVTGDTLVTLNDRWDKIENIRISDSLKSFNGKKLIPSKINGFQRKKSHVIKIKPYYLLPIRATPDHEFFIRDYQLTNDGVKFIGEPYFSPLKILFKNWLNRNKNGLAQRGVLKQRIGFPINTSSIDQKIDKDQLQFIGYFITEGSFIYGSGNSIKIELKDNTELSSLVPENIKKTFGLSPKISEFIRERKWGNKSTKTKMIVFKISDVAIGQLLHRSILGRYSYEKHFTNEIANLPIKKQKILLDAMWLGDGSKFNSNGNYYVTYDTSSILLIIQVQEMLLRQNQIYPVQVTLPNSGSLAKRPIYRVSKENLRNQKGLIENNILWTAIAKITDDGDSAQVYDLSILNYHNYRTCAGLVHNCGHILKTGFREGVDGIDYFSDREDMKLLRATRQAELKKIEDARKAREIGKFKPVDIRDFTNE